MIAFRLSSTSGLSTYLQLAQQVRQALRLGTLQPGDQLPTVKEVVGTLAINPNTVLKAYRVLESEGLVQGRPGQGTFVIRSLQATPSPQQAALRSGLEGWVRDALAAGLDADALDAMFDAALRSAQEEGVA
jgi:GntR family transcriptional regulator